MIRAAIAVGALFAMTGCATTTGSAPRIADEAAIRAQGERWNALYAAGDFAGLRALYEADAWLMTDNAPAAKSADAIIAYLQRYRSAGSAVRFHFKPEDVTVDRPYGFLIAKYWMTATVAGRDPVRSSGRSLLVYKWRDGAWRIWRDIDNRSPDVRIGDMPTG